MSRRRTHGTRTGRRTLLVVALVAVMVGASFSVGVAASQHTVTLNETATGPEISVASDGQTVFINATNGSNTGGTETVTVANATGSISVTINDDGNGNDPVPGDGFYTGSFTITSGASDPGTDTLNVAEGNDATATLDTGSATVTADYSPPGISAAETTGSSGGDVNRINVTFNESIDDSASTLAPSSFSLSSGSVDSVSTGTTADDDKVTLAVSGLSGTDPTPDVTLSAGAMFDEAGNSAGAAEKVTSTDGTAPVQISQRYNDTNLDGQVDTLRVTYSEPVDGSAFADGDWNVDVAGDPNVQSPTNVRSGSSTDVVLIDVTADPNVTGPQTSSASNPRIEYSGTSIVDAQGNQAPTQKANYLDDAHPVLKSIESVDSDSDGQVDRIDVTFTEFIDDSQSSGADANDFTISGTDSGELTKGTLTVPDASDNTEAQLGVSTSTVDTALALELAYSGAKIEDKRSNPADTFTATTVADGAAPVVTTALVLDRDGDGNVDAATLKFSEDIDDGTVTASDYSIGGQAGEAVATLSSADDDTVQIRITTDANEASGTDAKEVTYSPGSTADAAGNTLASIASGDLSETDRADPVVSSFSLTADEENEELDVSFDASESLSTIAVSISGPESDTLSDSSFTKSGSTYSASLSVETNGDYTATLDTADDSAGNSLSSSPSDTATVSFISSGSGRSNPSELSDTSSRVRLSGSTGLSEVGVKFSGSRAGSIRATEVTALASPTPPGLFVTAVDVSVADSLTETPSTLKLAISRERLDDLGVSPGDLTVYRLNGGEWNALETRVVDRGSDTIVVEADTPGFSRFAVMAGGEEQSATTATPEPDSSTEADTSEPATDTETSESDADTPMPTEDQTVTDTQTPGFGVGVALVALIATALLMRRRD